MNCWLFTGDFRICLNAVNSAMSAGAWLPALFLTNGTTPQNRTVVITTPKAAAPAPGSGVAKGGLR